MLGQKGAAPRRDTQAGARPAFFIFGFPRLFLSVLLYFFGREFLQVIARLSVPGHIEAAAASDKVGAFADVRLDFTGFDCVDNCNFDKIRTSDCALIAAG